MVKKVERVDGANRNHFFHRRLVLGPRSGVPTTVEKRGEPGESKVESKLDSACLLGGLAHFGHVGRTLTIPTSC